jgi:hypothetical protein
VKLGTATVSNSVVLAVSEPEVPLTVTLYCPGATLLEAVKLRLLEYVVGFCEKTAVTPPGSPAMERLTLPLNPFVEFT